MLKLGKHIDKSVSAHTWAPVDSIDPEHEGGCADGFRYRILKEAGEESIEGALALFRNIRYGATGSSSKAPWVSEMTARDKEKARGNMSLGLTSKKCMQV